MENDIALLAAGYVGVRLSIIALLGYWLYKVATFYKPVELTVKSDEVGHRSVRNGLDPQ